MATMLQKLSLAGLVLLGATPFSAIQALAQGSTKPAAPGTPSKDVKLRSNCPEGLRFIAAGFPMWRVRVGLAAKQAGYTGWPDLPPTEGRAPKDLLWEGFVANPRALLFIGPEQGRVDALLLLQQKAPKNPGLAYWPVLVRHVESEPVLVPLLGKDAACSESHVWIWQQGAADQKGPKGEIISEFPGFQVVRNAPGCLTLGPADSDGGATYVYGLGDRLAFHIDELVASNGQPEGDHGPSDADFLALLKRSAFKRAKQIGEIRGYIWFEVDGQCYATEQDHWNLWKRGPRPSRIVESQ